jgi:hypothetical protein
MGHCRWIDPRTLVGDDIQGLTLLAVVAKSVSACSISPFVGGNVAARRAGIVVVMDT